MKENIKKDYLWNTIGVFAQNAISPLLLVVVTRLNGVDGSGLFSFAFSVALIFWALGIWGGRTYQVSDVKHEFSPRSYITVRLILSICMVMGSILFCLVNHYDVFKTTVILALVLFKVLESVADVLYGILQVNGRLFISGRSLLYKAFFGFTTFLVIDIYSKNIFLAALGIVGVNFLVLLAYDIPRARRFEKVLIPISQLSQHVKDALTIMRRCVAIFIVIFLSMFSLNIPRYFIDQYHGEQIGYFGILVMPITALGLVITFILQPNVVQLSKQLSEGKYDEFKKTVNKLLLVIIGIGALVLLATYLIGTQALSLIFGVSFSPYMLALMIIVVGAVINACVTIYINILVIMRHFKAQFYILLFSNVGLVILSIIIIKQYGLIGGVSLYCAINAVQLSLLILNYKNLMRQMSKIKV
jgi:O-antigen/teichoic acid export membrane protein